MIWASRVSSRKPNRSDADDLLHMRAALGLARRALGNCWPNPAVGCVLVKEGVVVGRGWTQSGGRPHAEVVAIGRAGAEAKRATAYVTLEPCNHHGRTPPCTDAMIDAGIRRVVASIVDPDPRVSGSGFEKLRGSRIDVVEGVCADIATRLNGGYLQRVAAGRPLFTLKTATTLDGRIAAANRSSRWITGISARRRGHQLRDSHDAVLVGIGTAMADDPTLTCRLPGLPRRPPVRVILDSKGRLPAEAKLAQTAALAPLWIVTAQPENLADPVRSVAEIIKVPLGADGHIDLRLAATALGDRGLTRVLVEAGSELSAAMLRADLVDRIAWFRAPSAMGGDGVPAIDSLGLGGPDDAPRFRRYAVERLAEDLLEHYDRAEEA